MKRFVTVIALLIACAQSVFAQGTVIFNNRISATLNAPVTGVDGANLSGADYWVQLYAAPDASSLQPIGTPTPFRTGLAAGFWQSQALTIPTVAPGALAVMQVLVWFSGAADGVPDYPTFNAAVSAGQPYGCSDLFNIRLGGGNPPFPDANILGNPETSLTPLPDNFYTVGGLVNHCIPEPAVLPLGCLGAAVLFFGRRESGGWHSRWSQG